MWGRMPSCARMLTALGGLSVTAERVNNPLQVGNRPAWRQAATRKNCGADPLVRAGPLAPLVELKPDPLAGRGARRRPGGLPHKFFAARDETQTTAPRDVRNAAIFSFFARIAISIAVSGVREYVRAFRSAP